MRLYYKKTYGKKDSKGDKGTGGGPTTPLIGACKEETSEVITVQFEVLVFIRERD